MTARPAPHRPWALAALAALALGAASFAGRATREAAVTAWQRQQRTVAELAAARIGGHLGRLSAALSAVPTEGLPAGSSPALDAALARQGLDPAALRASIEVDGHDHQHPGLDGLGCPACARAGALGLAGPAQADGRRVVAQLRLESLAPLLAEGHGWVVSDDGLIVAHADPAQVGTRPFAGAALDPRLREMLDRMEAGEHGAAAYTWTGAGGAARDRLAAFAPLPGAPPGVAVAVSSDRAEALAGVDGALTALALAAAATAGLGALAAREGARARARAAEAEGRALASRLARAEADAQQERLALLGTLTAGVAHDLRNPATALLLTAEALREDPAAAPALVDDLAETARGLVHMADELTAFARGGTTGSPMGGPGRCTPEEALRVARRFARARVAGAEVEPGLEALPPVALDAHHLGQVLMNLLVNAVEAGGQPSVGGAADGGMVRLWVDDDGPGVPEDLRGRLFEPFATQGKPQGTGLGLWQCRGVLAAAGGSLRCERSPRGGARFELRLPRAA